MSMMSADVATRDKARQYKSELLASVFGVPAAAVAPGVQLSMHSQIPAASNVVGVGYGAKQVSGAGVDEVAVRVYVRAKMPPSLVPAFERIPPDVNGLPTDVVAVGDLVAQVRPTSCGVSIGHVAITAGTLGCLVVRTNDPNAASPERLILSNNHVLANENNAAPGDRIVEPGPIDGGTQEIATLTDFEPIDYSGKPNTIDAAIARVTDQSDVTPDIKAIGNAAAPPKVASLYQSVRKHGRTTLHTVGVILDLSADIKVRYGNQLAQFDDQLGVVGVNGPFSQGGDSGSLIVDAVGTNPVGLLFAGGGNMTFANPIEPVLSRFGVRVL